MRLLPCCLAWGSKSASGELRMQLVYVAHLTVKRGHPGSASGLDGTVKPFSQAAEDEALWQNPMW